MNGEANFTLIGGFNPAYVKKYGIQSAVNSDPDRVVSINPHISAIPNDVKMCVVPYEVKDTSKSLRLTNFLKARWLCLDVDNDKLPEDKKWDRKQIFNYLANKGYNFHICGSPTQGNYKVFIECRECDNFKKYEHFTKVANTMAEGLGDPDYQGRNTIVVGYICGYNGGGVFNTEYSPSAYTTTPKKVAQGGSMAVNYEMDGWDEEQYKKLCQEFKNRQTIRGICRNLVPHSNGTISLHLSDEKTSGGYFIRPGESIYIFKAGAGKVKYLPQDFFVNDSDNHKIYTLLRQLCNAPSAIAMMMGVDKKLGIEALCDRKIIRNDVLRKAGCKVKERDNKGKWNLAFIWQGTKYYSQNRAEMIKLLNRLDDKVIGFLKDMAREWLGGLFKKKEQCTCDNNISYYKGRTEEQTTILHNKMMEVIKGWFKKEINDGPPKYSLGDVMADRRYLTELRDMRILI